jgi:hypothetical protein
MTQNLKLNSVTSLKNFSDAKVFEIKSYYKTFGVSLNLDEINKKIIFSVSQKNHNDVIKYRKSISFVDLTQIDLNFFIPFKNDIIILFKYLIRLLKSKMLSIRTSDYDNNIVLILHCLKENKSNPIEIEIPNVDSDSEQPENENDEYEKKEDINSLEDIKENNDNIEGESGKLNNNIETTDVNDYNCASVINSSGNLYNDSISNIFYYNLKKKDYFIYLYKNEFKIKGYTEIIFKIVCKEDNDDIEYFAYKDLLDFIHLSRPYYNLFNYSINDFYDDLFIILYNHIFKIEIANKKLILFIQIFNSSYTNNFELY